MTGWPTLVFPAVTLTHPSTSVPRSPTQAKLAGEQSHPVRQNRLSVQPVNPAASAPAASRPASSVLTQEPPNQTNPYTLTQLTAPSQPNQPSQPSPASAHPHRGHNHHPASQPSPARQPPSSIHPHFHPLHPSTLPRPLLSFTTIHPLSESRDIIAYIHQVQVDHRPQHPHPRHRPSSPDHLDTPSTPHPLPS